MGTLYPLNLFTRPERRAPQLVALFIKIFSDLGKRKVQNLLMGGAVLVGLTSCHLRTSVIPFQPLNDLGYHVERVRN
jgi:hypothetical protein